jgi:hypothetical protein
MKRSKCLEFLNEAKSRDEELARPEIEQRVGGGDKLGGSTAYQIKRFNGRSCISVRKQ